MRYVIYVISSMPKAASLSTDYRLAILWLIIGAVICVKTGRPVDTTHSYRILLLPSPKAVWEAPAQLSWHYEYEASRVTRICGLSTIGELLDAQELSHLTSNSRKLDKWNADIDNLGFLLNLIAPMMRID